MACDWRPNRDLAPLVTPAGARLACGLKAAADAVGKPIYLELSSINPVVILPGALGQRGEKIADEFATSCLSAVGQYCTNPGLVMLLAGPDTEKFIEGVAERFKACAGGDVAFRRGG